MTVKEFKEKLSKFDDDQQVEFIVRLKYIDIEYDFKEVITEDNKVLVVFDA